jgi:hypothetical protein
MPSMPYHAMPHPRQNPLLGEDSAWGAAAAALYVMGTDGASLPVSDGGFAGDPEMHPGDPSKSKCILASWHPGILASWHPG